ncbi:transposon Tn10 TetD protein [Ruminiclostridium hungatei]|uniref:Transposon Tn10 TetD protein n=1 Tax=Ruminiclostridium hungatei TaxID=48256 RepID=A0A1V4SL14_RUMHU|nr:helix-turn-helix domain-containing protein [Ruminiclostridium hungatei]OPX43937.1 transposon Tn10 TetD protein [Ruminiclostridium hungatei]
MNSSKAFDDVILYLEKIISDGSEIDYGEISKITMSPSALFQRIFIFVSGISIYDYVRKRRLTLAGHELKNNGISVIDAAVKFGFQSHSAFTRAFKEQHGITPSEAKLEAARLNDYLPINFSEMRFIGGKRIMAEMKRIIYKKADERLMVGMHRETSFSEAGGVWRDFFQSGVIEKLNLLSNVKCCGDIDENDGIGFMHNFVDNQNFHIIIGDFVQPGTEIPEGLFARHVPQGLTAQVQIEGNNVADILASAYLLITEAVEKTGGEIDYENFYWCEVYTHERFSEPLNRGEKVTIDYVMPVKARNE